MELYQLKTFTVVAEEGNLTRAAKRLYASQPAVSAHIKALEDELGLSLFQRTPKGMLLTADGVKLKAHAERVLTTIDEMTREADKMRGVLQGELRIGINAEPETLRISDLFSTMKADHPELHIHLLQAMSGEVLQKSESDVLDAGFMYGDIDGERLYAAELQKLPLVVAGPGEWQADLAGATAKDLGTFPWIMTPDDCPFHTVASELFNRHGIAPQRVALVDQESIIKSMIRAGVGLSLMLKQDVVEDANSGKLAIWEGEELYLKLSIACLKRRRDEPILQALFANLARIWEMDTL